MKRIGSITNCYQLLNALTLNPAKKLTVNDLKILVRHNHGNGDSPVKTRLADLHFQWNKRKDRIDSLNNNNGTKVDEKLQESDENETCTVDTEELVPKLPSLFEDFELDSVEIVDGTNSIGQFMKKIEKEQTDEQTDDVYEM